MEQTEDLTIELIKFLYTDAKEEPLCPLAAEWEYRANLRQRSEDWWRPEEYQELAKKKKGYTYPSRRAADEGVRKHLRENLVWRCLLRQDYKDKLVKKEIQIPTIGELINDETICTLALTEAHLNMLEQSNVKEVVSLSSAFSNELKRPELRIAMFEGLFAVCGYEKTHPARKKLKDVFNKAKEAYTPGTWQTVSSSIRLGMANETTNLLEHCC